jgi:hypothetical protein
MPESFLARSGTDANPHTLKPMDCRTEPPRPLSDVLIDIGLRLDFGVLTIRDPTPLGTPVGPTIWRLHKILAEARAAQKLPWEPTRVSLSNHRPARARAFLDEVRKLVCPDLPKVL